MAIAKKLTASAIASSLLLAIAGPAFAADQTVDSIATKMFDLGIVKGNGTDLNLDGTLTRAELVTTIVRSFGLENAAVLAKGAPSFADVSATEWYSGWVAVAKNLAEQKGVKLGVDANTFNPNGQLSKAEALVFVMKFLGINVQATATGNWYDAWINEAVARGIITEAQGADIAATANAKSTRGEAFVVIDRGYSYKDANGKSLYTTNIDAVNPVLNLTVAPTTTDAEITLSGTATDNKGVASVVINGQAVTLNNGAFSTKAALTVGTNSIVVVVTDLAGNTITKTYEVARGNVDAASIEASDVTVTAGASATVEAKLVDKNGEAIANAAITGESTLGTFVGGVFTAGTKAGEGTLVLKSGDITKTVAVKVEAAALAKVVAPATVKPGERATVAAQDQYGNAVAGATFGQTSADALIDATTGSFIASKAGSYTVTATKNGVTVEGKIGVYGTADALKVNAPSTMIGNDASVYTVTVDIVDENGNRVTDATNTVELDGPTGTTATLKSNKNGVATFEVTVDNTLAGSTIELTATADTLDAGTASVEVEAQVATSLKLTTDKFIDVKDTDGITATIDILDQAGKSMLEGIYDVNVEVSGAAFLNEADKTSDTLTWSTADKTFTLLPQDVVTLGNINVNISSEGLGTAAASLTAAYAGDAAKIALTAPESTTLTAISATDVTTEALEYSVRLTDKNGVPVESDEEIVLNFADVADKANTWVNVGDGFVTVTAYEAAPTALTFEDGIATFQVIGAKADTFTVKATDKASELTASATSTVTVKAGAAKYVAFAGEAADDTVNLNILRGTTTGTTLKVTATDKYGNAVAAEGLKVTFAAPAKGVTIDGKTESVVKYTNANGEVTADVAIANYVTGPVTIALTHASDDTIVEGTVANVELNAQYFLPASISASFAQDGNGRTSIAAGDAFDILVSVKDQEGNLFDATNLPLEGLFDVTVGGEAVDFSVVAGDTGKYTISIDQDVVTKKGTAEVKVAIKELVNAVSVTRNLTVNAGTPAGFRVVEATWTDAAGLAANKLNDMDDTFDLSYDKDVAKAFTVQITDEFGNAVTGTNQTSEYSLALSYTGASDAGEYAVFTDANGVPKNTLTIAKGKTTAQVYLRTNATGSVEINGASLNLSVNVTVK